MGILLNIATTCIRTSDGRREPATASLRQSFLYTTPRCGYVPTQTSDALSEEANRSANCKSLFAIWRTAPRTAKAIPPFGEPFRELQEPFCHLANRSANCKSHSAIWRTVPRTARAISPFGEPLRELQEPFRHLANRSASCKSLFAIGRTVPRTARAISPFGEPFRELQEPFRHLANCSANCKTLITRTMGGHTIVISHINISR